MEYFHLHNNQGIDGVVSGKTPTFRYGKKISLSGNHKPNFINKTLIKYDQLISKYSSGRLFIELALTNVIYIADGPD